MVSGVQEAIMALRFRPLLPQLAKIQVKNGHTFRFESQARSIKRNSKTDNFLFVDVHRLGVRLSCL